MKTRLNTICFSRLNYWHGIKGGMDVHGKSISEGLVEQGHQATIISTRHPSGKIYEECNGVAIHYLENTVFGSRRNGWGRSSLAKFHDLNASGHYNLIWSQSFDAFGIFRSARGGIWPTPVVSSLHGSIEQESKTALLRLKRGRASLKSMVRTFGGLIYSYLIVQKPLLQIADKIIAVSPQVLVDLKKWYGEKIVSKAVTIPNGIDINHFKPDERLRLKFRKKFDLAENEILLLCIGRLKLEKGYHVALDALKKLIENGHKARLMIIGTGDGYDALAKKTEELELSNAVIYPGFVENQETCGYYNCADIFLMPSLTVEGLPVVLIEAMACGKPIIASKIGGNPFVISDGENGFLISAGDSDGMAARVQCLSSNSDLCAKLANAARKTAVKYYSSERMIQETIQVFASVL